jgi:transposase
MKNSEDYNYKNIKCDSKLLYKTSSDELFLLISYYEKVKELESSKKFISIDPGQKIFLTGITPKKIYKIGSNLTDTIEKQLIRIDHLNTINNKKSKRLVNIIYTKIKNQIVDLHWKSINYLILYEKIRYIIIGNWSTKDCISNNNNNNNNKLKAINKRIINMLSYYKFLQRLSFKCSEYNIKLTVTEEAYTSKVCCKCGTVNNKIENRILNCSNCNYSINRDINGAVNILFKNL